MNTQLNKLKSAAESKTETALIIAKKNLRRRISSWITSITKTQNKNKRYFC